MVFRDRLCAGLEAQAVVNHSVHFGVQRSSMEVTRGSE